MKSCVVYTSIYSFDKNHYNSMHSHNEMEIILYLKANAISKIDNTIYNVRNNTIAIINPGVYHDEFHKDACQNILVRFNFDHFKIPNGVYHTKQPFILEQIMRKILNESKHPQFGYNELIDAKIEELNILIMREIIHAKYNNNKNMDNLDQLYSYLQDNCTSKLDLKKVAADFGFTYDYIRNKFKNVYGLSPLQLVSLKKLQKAVILLEESDKSCTEIAIECGFSDVAHFSKIFKRYYGYSPSEFTKYKQ